jgi:ribose transport system permease protein
MSTTHDNGAAPDTRGKAAAQVSRYALLGLLILFCIIFSALKPETFGTWDNFRSILDNEVTIVLVALGATLPLIVGQFDLSVAAMFTWAQLIVVGQVLEHSWSPLVAILVALLCGVVIGLLNGIAVVRFKINSFIATLATSSLLTGAALAYTNGESIFGQAPTSLTGLARNQLLGIPLPVVYGLIIAVVLGIVLGRMPVGRRMYATGGNERAAQITGIATSRYVIATFVASSILASLGGIIVGARIGAASTDVGGTVLIQAFAGAFLGTTAFVPGRFNIWGTVVAVYVVGVTVTGLEQLGASLWVEPVFQGAVLFLAVGLSAYTANYRARRARQARLRELEERRAAEDAATARAGASA